MAGPLTWRNVDAPDLRGSLDGLRIASSAFNQGFGSLAQGLERFDTARKEDAESQLLTASLAYNDPAKLREAIAGGLLPGLNSGLLGRQAVAALDGRVNGLLQQATAEEALNHDRLNNPQIRRGVELTNNRTLQTTTNEGLRAPLERDHLRAQTGASNASAASSMASAAASRDGIRRANLLFPEQLTQQQYAARQAQLNFEQDKELGPVDLRTRTAQAVGAEGNNARAAQQELERRFPEAYAPAPSIDQLLGLTGSGTPAASGSGGSSSGRSGSGSGGHSGSAAGNQPSVPPLLAADTLAGTVQRNLNEAAGQLRGGGNQIANYDALARTNETPAESVKLLRAGSYSGLDERTVQRYLDDVIQRSGGKLNNAQARSFLENNPQGNGEFIRYLRPSLGGGDVVPNMGRINAAIEDYSRNDMRTQSDTTQTLDLASRRIGLAQQLADQSAARLAQVERQPDAPQEVRDRMRAQAQARRETLNQLLSSADAPQFRPERIAPDARGGSNRPAAPPAVVPAGNPTVAELSPNPMPGGAPAASAPADVRPYQSPSGVRNPGPVSGTPPVNAALAAAISEARQPNARPLGVIAGAHGLSRRQLQRALEEATR